MALHPDRPLIERAAATAAMLEMHFDDTRRRRARRRHRRVRVVDRAAALVLGVRSVLPALYRRCAARAGRRVPAAERRLSAIGALRRRSRRGVAAGDRAALGRNAPGRSIGSPAGCGPRSTTARSTRSWPTACRATCRAFAGSASTCTRRSTKPTSPTPPRSAFSVMSGDRPVLRSAHDRFTYSAPISESVMEVRMQPRGDGRQRCLRFELTTQPRARVFAYQDPSATSCTTSTSRAATRACRSRRMHRRDVAPTPAIPDSLARHGVGRPGRARRIGRALAQRCSPATSPARRRCSQSSPASCTGSAMPIR